MKAINFEFLNNSPSEGGYRTMPNRSMVLQSGNAPPACASRTSSPLFSSASTALRAKATAMNRERRIDSNQLNARSSNRALDHRGALAARLPEHRERQPLKKGSLKPREVSVKIIVLRSSTTSSPPPEMRATGPRTSIGNVPASSNALKYNQASLRAELTSLRGALKIRCLRRAHIYELQPDPNRKPLFYKTNPIH